MSSSAASSTVLLNRILTLKESSPFILALDTIAQSSYHFTNELIHKIKTSPNLKVSILYLSFETTNKPAFADEFISCLNVPINEIQKQLESRDFMAGPKTLVIVDSFNYIRDEELNDFLRMLITPNTVLFGTYHLSIPVVRNTMMPNQPNLLTRLQFISTTVFEIKPMLSSSNNTNGIDEEEMENFIALLDLPIKLTNLQVFEVELTYKRKSGRSLVHNFIMNTKTHEYELKQPRGLSSGDGAGGATSEEQLLEGLTTFNLTTTQKQKIAKDQVDLPYLEAQKALGSMGGAIVYEFEKDDDYDEEDPYEDPF